MKQKNKKKIYIAGKISGENQLACTMKFERVQRKLEAEGYHVINPLQVVGTWDITWIEAMKKCIVALLDCDELYLLRDWNESDGAVLEQNLAQNLNITKRYE